MTRLNCSRLVLVVCAITLVAWVNAGDLNPPPEALDRGAPVPTGRFGPLTEITSLASPITMSGSYYLGGNLNGSSVLVIQSDDVTLDFNGFVISGGARIVSSGTRNGITIRNGRINNSSNGSSIDLTGLRHVVEDMVIVDSGGTGIRVGSFSIIRRCIVQDSLSNGIQGDGECVITDCISVSNESTGIVVGSNGIVVNSASTQNTGPGIQLGDGGIVQSCTTQANRGPGIAGLNNCVIANSNASANFDPGPGIPNGIDAQNGSVIRGCTARSNEGVGITVAEGLRDGNSAVENGTANSTGSGSQFDNHFP